MLNIVCVNANNYLGKGADYVNILADMVARNISDKTIYKFICFTDTPQGIDVDVNIRPLPVDGLEGWWNKLSLFKEGLFLDGDRTLYLDLDTVITSGLDDIIKYDGEFAILRDFIRNEGCQSSVIAWKANTLGFVWDKWLESGMPKTDEGDQRWIENIIPKPEFLQDLFPDCFVSYKLGATSGIPKNCRMVVFHGKPRPHEITDGWIPKVWKIGGGTTLELQHVCNTEEQNLIDNIKNSLTLGLPKLQMMEAHDGHAVIVGGGPSLKRHLDEIRERQKHNQVIFSTNNTYQYLVKNGIIPDCHAMVDARPENTEFLPSEDHNSICYYASQCHPSLFQNAKNAVLWHSMDEGIQQYIGNDTGDPLVGGGSTIGMKSLALAWILGYRQFHLYGMDSSYEKGENHAYPQALNNNEKILELFMGDKKYLAAPWMCTQVENFKEVSQELIAGGCIITVHGTGLLPDVARVLSMSIPAHKIRAKEILGRLTVENPVGAEIGVFTGALSSELLKKDGMILYMVDSWATSDIDSEYAKSGDFHAALNQQQQDRYFESTRKTVEFAGEKAKIIRKPSVEAAQDISDATLDFVFIDADHSYSGCKADILSWVPKLKPCGLLSGHDYKNVDYPCFGVEKAVDEFSQNTNLPVELGDNFTWFIRLAA